VPAYDAHRRRCVPLHLLAVLRAGVIAGCLALVAVGATATALGATATKVVAYHGLHLTVPAGWPVYRLDGRSTTCVRFDRHAVYLGAPGADQRCPAHAAGRTEAILVSPARVPDPLPAGGSDAQLSETSHHVKVTATWDHQPALIRRALGVRSLASAVAASARTPAASPRARAMATSAGSGVTGSGVTAASVPGGVYTGLGFDACATPSLAQMSAWHASSYRAIGVYIGGTNMACAQPNLNSAWVSAESAAGWHLIPIYVGLQAPSNSCGCAAISARRAASEGAAAASDAVLQAQAVGLGAGNPLYFDMEGYDQGTATSSTVLTFLAAWTSQLHTEGYKSGVYSSADSGIRDLVSRTGSGYTEPDDIWIADWNNARNTADASVPSTDWPAHQRLHQYSGAHNETHGATTINIDGDYVDAATAAAGTVTTEASAGPSLSVAPVADGTIDLYPSWRGAQGVSSWQVLAGASPSALSPVAGPISAGGRLPIVLTSAYPYVEVRALGSTGQTLGASPAVATPAHVSIFGSSVFVPRRGPAAVPVSCFGISVCRVTVTIAARTRLVLTGPEQIPAGGGLAYVGLSPADHALVTQASRHRLTVTITVRTSTGSKATRRLNLVPYTTTGRSPRRRIRSSSSIRILSATAFVANRWSGAVLAACLRPTPCSPKTTLVAAGQVIARTAAQALGAGEVGYLRFRLTPAGHSLLASSHGNQLAAELQITDSTDTASAAIALSSFS
jgi:hypothetical protein